MTEWRFLREDVVRAWHLESLAEHGGAQGVRDEGLLRSALARPLNLAGYEAPDAAALAASYAIGIAKNHPFVDGNKRAAATCAIAFLNLNGFVTAIDDGELVLTFLAVAAGDMSEDELARWLRDRIVS